MTSLTDIPGTIQDIVESARAMADRLGSDVDTARNVAPAFTCSELDSIVTVLAYAGHRDVAEHWVESHKESESEEAGDFHYRVDPVSYVDRLLGNVLVDVFDHNARPDDREDNCKDCDLPITWIGPSQYDWLHAEEN